MKGAPYPKSAFKDGGHGGEAYHTHETGPTEGAPTAKPGGLLSQEAINKQFAANKKAAESSSNDKRKSKSKRKSGWIAKARKHKGKRPKKGNAVTYKCTSKGCSAMN